MNASILKIYKASAGSGKTYTLAKEYIKILILHPYHYKNILAITFTKKATAEMKNRILLFLKQLSNGTNAQLAKHIIDELKVEKSIDVSQTIALQAEKALNLILHDYGHFQVTTIDSFFQLIIRSFAKELNLPIGMQVEIDSDKVLEFGVDGVLEAYEENEELAEWLEKFAFNNIDNDKDWKIDKSIFELGKELFKEEFNLQKDTIDDLKPTDYTNYKETVKAQQNIINNYRNFIRTQVNTIEQIIEKHQIDISLMSSNFLNGFLKNAKNEKFEDIKTIQKVIEGTIAIISKGKLESFPAESSKIQAIWDNEIRDKVIAILDFHHQNEKNYITAKSIVKNIFALALLDALAHKINDYRSNENVILISDASLFISKIADAESIPFIYEKTSTFINYILIDEFQDTSTLQWRSLRPIVDEILSGKLGGLSLIVGDAKQSIYRWRGGKMELILRTIDEDLKKNESQIQKSPLNYNFRSLTNIIQFNNTFFDSAIKNFSHLQLLNLAYQAHQQEQSEANKIEKNGGYVTVTWTESKKKNDKVEDDEELEDEELSSIVKVLLDAKKRFEFKDIAILVRTNNEAAIVAEYIKSLEEKIDFVSGESLLIKNNLEVKLLIASLEFLMTTEKFFQYKLENLYCNYKGISDYNQILVDKTEFEFQQLFKEKQIDIKQLKNDTLINVVHVFMHVYNIDRESNAYILRLLDDVYSFVQKNSNNIIAYLYNWYEKNNKISVLPSESSNAVQIMTIHKSKGLEFPVVILPFANWSLSPRPNSIFWAEDESENKFVKNHNVLPLGFVKALEKTYFSKSYIKETDLSYIDNINVLYVAFTRAEKELHVLAKSKSDKDIKNASSLIRLTLESCMPDNFIDDNTFVFGHPVVKTEDKNSNIIPSKEFGFSEINTQSEFKLSKSDFSDENIRKGNITHEMMINIHQSTIEENDFLKLKQKYQITEDEETYFIKLRQQIHQLFVQNQFINEQFTYWYEKDFYFKNNIWRADIVIETPTQNIIIDYKTGVESTSHEKQIEVYKTAYQQMSNKETLAYLCYFEPLQLKKV